MAVTYCTADQVVARLGMVNQSDGTRFTHTDIPPATTPSTTEIETFINEAEDEIDRRTQTAFRSVTETDIRYDVRSGQYIGNRWAIAIKLRHDKIKTLSSGS